MRGRSDQTLFCVLIFVRDSSKSLFFRKDTLKEKLSLKLGHERGKMKSEVPYILRANLIF